MRHPLRLSGALILLLIVIAGLTTTYATGGALVLQTPTPPPVDENLWRAWNSEALFLANLSQQALAAGDVRLALHQALAGLEHYPDGVYHDENYLALLNALRDPGAERLQLWQPTVRPGSGALAAVSPDRRSVATWIASSSETDVYLWDYTTGERRFSWRLSAPIGTVAWLDDGTRLFIATDPARLGSNAKTHQVGVWDATTGEPLWTSRIDTGLDYVSLNADQTQLLTAQRGEITLWDVATGATLQTLPVTIQVQAGTYPAIIEKAVFSSDSRRVLTLSKYGYGNILAQIELWDMASGELLLEIPPLERGWVDFVVSADDQYLLAWERDERIQLWDVQNNVLVGEYTLLQRDYDGGTRPATVGQGGFDPTGRYFYAGTSSGRGLGIWSVDGTVEPVWQALDGVGLIWGSEEHTALWWGTQRYADSETDTPVIQIVNFVYGEGDYEYTPEQRPLSVAWSVDERLIAVSQYVSYSQDTALTVLAVNGDPILTRQFDVAPHAYQFIGSDELVLTLRDGSTHIYNMQPLLPISPGDGRLRMWSQDGTLLLGSSGQTIHVWDAAQQTLLSTIEPAIEWRSITFSPDGASVLAWNNGGELAIHAVATGELVQRIDVPLPAPESEDVPESLLFGASWNADGSQIAAWGNAPHVMIWDAATGTMQHDLFLADMASLYGWVEAAWNPIQPDRLLTWSPDGQARIWDTTTGQVQRAVTHGESLVIAEASPDSPGGMFSTPIAPRGAAWSPDGMRVLSYVESDPETTHLGNWLVFVWSETDDTVITLPQQSPIPHANMVVWADNQRIVTPGVLPDTTETWQVWDAATGNVLREEIAPSAIGRLGRGRRAGEIMLYLEYETRLYDVVTGDLLLILPPGLGEVWSPDGTQLLTSRGIMPVELDALIAIAQAYAVYNPLTVNEVEQSYVITPEVVPTQTVVPPTVTPWPTSTLTPTATLTPTPTANATLGALVQVDRFADDAALGINSSDWRMPGHDAARTRHNPDNLGLRPPLIPLWTQEIDMLIPDSLTVSTYQIGLSGQWFFPGDSENAAMVRRSDTGEEIWHYPLSAQAGGAMNVPLTFTQDRVIFGGQHDDNLYAVDRQTGELAWMLPGFTSLYGTDMAVVDNWLIVPSQYTGAMMLNAYSGETVWGGPARGAGAVAIRHGLIYAHSNQGRTIAAYDPVTGSQVWAFDDIPARVNWQWLVAGEDYLYFKTAPNEVAALDYATQTIVWRTMFENTSDLGSGGPALAYGRLFVPVYETTDGRAALVTLDAHTGEIRWTYEQAGRGMQSVTVADGIVYALGTRRTLLAFDARDGVLLWQQELLGGRGGSEIVAAQGLLYVLAGDDLYAFVSAPDDYATPTPTPVVIATPLPPTPDPAMATQTAVAAFNSTIVPQATTLAAEHPVTLVGELPAIGAVQGVTLNHDKSRALSWTDEGFVTLWNLDTGEFPVELEFPATVGGASWNTSETRIGIWTYDETGCTDNCEMTATIVDVDPASDTFKQVLFTHTQTHSASLLDSGGVVWSPDDTRILVWSNLEGAYVLDGATGQIRFALPHDKPAWGAFWTGDGTRVITWATTGFAEGAARIWTIPARGSIQLLPDHVLQHGSVVWGAALNADETRLLTWSLDATAAVWDMATGQALAVFAHDDMVWDARWLADGRVLTSSFDGTARIWEVDPEAREVIRWEGDSRLTRSALSPDGQWVLSAAGNRVIIWNAQTGETHFELNGQFPVDPWRPGSSEALITDQTVAVWDVAARTPVSVLLRDGPLQGGQWLSADRLLTWADDGYLRIWQLE